MSNDASQPADFFNPAEQKAADLLLQSITSAGSNNLPTLDVSGITKAYENLCSAASVRHGTFIAQEQLRLQQNKG